MDIKHKITYINQLFLANGIFMSRHELFALCGIILNEQEYLILVAEITTNKRIKQNYRFSEKQEIFKDNTTPRTEIEINNNFYIYKIIIYAFTDGSKCNINNNMCAGAGVFFKTGSSLNNCFRIPGEQTSYATKLFAIKNALNNIPINRSAVIVTDNLTAINEITNFKEKNTNQSLKTRHRSIINRILKIETA
jgi:hypothetical protein